MQRYFSLSKNKEMAEALIQQASESSSTTTSSISFTSEPVVAIDSFPPKPSSFEQQQQQGEGMIRDARLQFLKTILQKIKQHAEDMGFDGTMQVSVIEMEPQTDEQFSPFGGKHLNQQHQIPKGQSFHPLLPNFFPHLPIEGSSNNQQQQAPKSDSFMDGFGEYHQPTFMQNNQDLKRCFGCYSRWLTCVWKLLHVPHNFSSLAFLLDVVAASKKNKGTAAHKTWMKVYLIGFTFVVP
uniref:Uncharacterized protein n=1 Tax=Ditylenchus dipsaci TaxID=166011 RepID=A0A915CRY7_9BILA